MKIAYGTYAMPTVRLEEAFPALARMGYEGVEIFIGAPHLGALPDQMDGARRRRLRDLLRRHSLGLPALFLAGSIYTPSAVEHQANLERMRVCSQLARDLGLDACPVLAMGFGGSTEDWDSLRDQMVELLHDYAEVAEQEDFTLAGEAHCGAAVDRSQRIVWLLETVNHPRIRFHFDIVHLFLSGEPLEDAVRALVPYTAHTHVTDARKHADGSFDLLLLGEGELDTTRYMRAMQEAGWEGFITIEVSTRVWSREDYEPMPAAQHSYNVLSTAFEQAGVPRG